MPEPERAMTAGSDTRNRILDVALDVLGERPTAGMGEIAAAAGVVRRTVYGHFPSRDALVRTIAQRAADELLTALHEVAHERADRAWVDFVRRVWPLAHRYRILLVLRRSEHSAEIHARLEPVERALTDLIGRGQDDGRFGRHLPAATLAQLAQSTVFTLAEAGRGTDVDAAAVTSLLLLGVPERAARSLVEG